MLGAGSDANDTIATVGHEIEHGTKSKMASGMIEHAATQDSARFLKKHGLLPKDYMPKSYGGLRF